LTGRFTTRDSYEGDVNTPASLNRFNYAHSNPVMNTDPSGHCIFTGMDTILCAALTGFVAGVAVGGAFGLATYTDALSGKCGCEMQQQATAAGSLGAYAGILALSGGVLGGIAGAIAIAAPIGLIAIGGLGVVASAADLYKTYNVIANETGITKCTVIRALMDIAGIITGGIGLKAGIQAWRASGSGLKWISTDTTTPEPISTSGARWYYNKAVQYPRATAALIGEYLGETDPRSYQNIAATKQLRHLDLDIPLYEEFKLKFGKDAWWKLINEPFVRYTANSRNPVYLSTDPKLIEAMPSNQGIVREYNLFRSLGYSAPKWDPTEGLWKMTVPRP
jgi:hypothetical protein